MAESELQKHLADHDPDLARRANMLWKLAEQIHTRATRPDASDNGASHCFHVELYLWRLINETRQLSKFTSTELFLLSCCACCHDFDRGLNSCIDKNAEHGEGSGEFVVNHHQKLLVPRPHAIAIDCIVRIHDKKGADYSDMLADVPEAYSLPTGTVNLQRLAVLLKAADTLHTDNSRVSELGTDPVKLEGVDRAKYLFRYCTNGWRIDGSRLVLSAAPNSDEELEAVCKGQTFMKDEEWSSIADALRRFNFPYKLEFEVDDHLLSRKAARETARDLPGMDYYQEGDAALFAGRDSEIRAIRSQVLGNRSSLLIGRSGVGKSSLIHAGLLPELERLSGWGVVVTRPDKSSGDFFTHGHFRRALDGSVDGCDGFADLCQRAAAKHRQLLVVLDQFEDIAYFGQFDIDAIVAPVLDALARNRKLKLLFSYRDDVESLLLPLWQAISHTAAGLPKCALQPLGRNGGEASLRKLAGVKRITLENDDVFVQTLLDELAAATSREAGFSGGTIYPPFIQMVVERLAELADRGLVLMANYEALATAGHSATDEVIKHFLAQSIANLPKYSFAEEDGRKVLVALAHSSGKKGSASEAQIAAETHISTETLTRLLTQMATMRLVRHMESGNWEIMHDLMAKVAIEELISEEDRRFKQVREILDARARAVDQYHDALAPHELKDLWTKRERLPPSNCGRQEYAVILLSMASMDSNDTRIAGSGYGHEIEDVRGELANPSRWAAPGWYWLSTLNAEELLDLARYAGKTGQIGGAVAYVRLASLLGSIADVGTLANLLVGPFLNFPKLAEDTIDCMAYLASQSDEMPGGVRWIDDATIECMAPVSQRFDLPMLRGMAKHEQPIVRRAAAKLIGVVGTRDDLTLLGKMASDEYPRAGAGGDVNVREAVAEAVGNLGFHDGLQVLEKMSRDGDGYVLWAIARSVASLRDEAGLALLENNLAKASYSPAKRGAAKAYAELKTCGDIEVLRKSATGNNLLMQEGAAWVLKDRGGPVDLPLLRELAKNGGAVRHAAVAAIGKLGNSEDLPLLRQLATGTGGDWPIRQCAVRAIASIGEHDDLALLQDIAVKDEVHIVCRTAARVCWRLATRQDLPLLRVTLQGGGGLEVSQEIVNAMARQYSDEEALPEMSEVMLAVTPVVGKMVAEATVPRASSEQLRDFLAHNQQKLPPPVLAVFDWYLYAPAYLRSKYEKWRAERNSLPLNVW